MDHRSPSMLKPALIGGGVAGIAGGLPLVGALNCACCALIIGGGFLAAYLYSRQSSRMGVSFRPGSGAVVGLVAGLFYTIAQSVVSYLKELIWPTDLEEIKANVLDQLEQGNASAEAIDMAERIFEVLSGPGGMVIGFCIVLILAAIFSTIGGLIGGAVFKVTAPDSLPPTAPSAGGSAAGD